MIRDLLARTIEAAIARHHGWVGETFSYRRTTNVTSIFGRLSVLNASTQYPFFTSTESASWASPRYLLTVAGNVQVFSSDPASGDFVRIYGTDYQVRKIHKVRVGAYVTKTLIFLAN